MEHGDPIDVFSSVTVNDLDHPDQFLMEEAMVMKRAGKMSVLLIRFLLNADLGLWQL